jgi:hypothetical protein
LSRINYSTTKKQGNCIVWLKASQLTTKISIRFYLSTNLSLGLKIFTRKQKFLPEQKMIAGVVQVHMTEDALVNDSPFGYNLN